MHPKTKEVTLKNRISPQQIPPKQFLYLLFNFRLLPANRISLPQEAEEEFDEFDV